jgi:hypothetical protein
VADDVVRLETNIALDTADVIRDEMARTDANITDTVTAAVATLHFLRQEVRAGRRVMVVDGTGDTATYREVFLLGMLDVAPSRPLGGDDRG